MSPAARFDKFSAVLLSLLTGASSALIGPNRAEGWCRHVRPRSSCPHSFPARRFSAAAVADDHGDTANSKAVATTKSKRYDPISDWVPPSPADIRRAVDERIGPMTALTSPVFFSTDANTGRRVRGLDRVPTPEEAEAGPDGRPRAVLFVSNHQLIGIDSWMVVSELIQQRSIHARSLAHPLVFAPGGGGGGGLLSSIVENGITTTNRLSGGGRSADEDASSSSFDFLETFGGVRVSPRNLYRLMATGQPTLLFPGGARESFGGREQGYALESWPPDDDRSSSDFVRVAAKFDATVVPFSSVGAAESAAFIGEAPDPSAVPFGLGDAVATLMGENVPFDARWDNGGEVLTLPFVVPKPVPARHGYLFHAPISLADLDHGDREACSEVYRKVKAEIRTGISDLLRAGSKDPYRDSARRLVYERVWKKQAPTFSLGELNRR